jgi:hypothetical protein
MAGEVLATDIGGRRMYGPLALICKLLLLMCRVQHRVNGKQALTLCRGIAAQ